MKSLVTQTKQNKWTAGRIWGPPGISLFLFSFSVWVPAGHFVEKKTVWVKFSQGHMALPILCGQLSMWQKERKTPLVCCYWMTLGLFVAAKLWINTRVNLGTLILKSQTTFLQQIKSPQSPTLLSDVLFVFCLLSCKKHVVYCSPSASLATIIFTNYIFNRPLFLSCASHRYCHTGL